MIVITSFVLESQPFSIHLLMRAQRMSWSLVVPSRRSMRWCKIASIEQVSDEFRNKSFAFVMSQTDPIWRTSLCFFLCGGVQQEPWVHQSVQALQVISCLPELIVNVFPINFVKRREVIG